MSPPAPYSSCRAVADALPRVDRIARFECSAVKTWKRHRYKVRSRQWTGTPPDALLHPRRGAPRVNVGGSSPPAVQLPPQPPQTPPPPPPPLSPPCSATGDTPNRQVLGRVGRKLTAQTCEQTVLHSPRCDRGGPPPASPVRPRCPRHATGPSTTLGQSHRVGGGRLGYAPEPETPRRQRRQTNTRTPPHSNTGLSFSK